MAVVLCYEDSYAIHKAIEELRHVLAGGWGRIVTRAPYEGNTIVYRDGRQWVIATTSIPLIDGLSKLPHWLWQYDDAVVGSRTKYFVAQYGELIDVAYHLETGGYGDVNIYGNQWAGWCNCDVYIRIGQRLLQVKYGRGCAECLHSFISPSQDMLDIAHVQVTAEGSEDGAYRVRYLSYSRVANHFLESMGASFYGPTIFVRDYTGTGTAYYSDASITKFRWCGGRGPTPFRALMCSALS